MSYLVNDVINRALKHARILRMGESATAGELQDALQTFNNMLAEWSVEGLMLVEDRTDYGVLTANTRTYTVGASGGAFTFPKPVKILGGYIKDSDSSISSLTVLTLEQYRQFGDRLTTKGQPRYLYYDAGASQQATPLGTLNFYPIPDLSTYTAYWQHPYAVTEYTALADVVTFPAWYRSALEFCLSPRLWCDYHEGEPPMNLLTLARQSKSIIERVNAPSLQARSGLHFLSSGGGYDIYSDT